MVNSARGTAAVSAQEVHGRDRREVIAGRCGASGMTRGYPRLIMESTARRDPISSVVQLLTLLVLTWIGFGVSGLGTLGLGAATESTNNEQLERTLTSLERLLSAQPPTKHPLTSDRPVAMAVDERPLQPTATGAVARELSEIRAMLATPASLQRDGAGQLGSIATTNAKAARDGTRKLWLRLHSSGPAEHDLARRDLLLTDRATLLRRFGKPHSISSNKYHQQRWTYRFGSDGARVVFRIEDGVVITVY